MTPGVIGAMAVFCFFGVMSGQALAGNWRPKWQIALYGVLLSLGARVATLILFARYMRGPADEAIEFALLAVLIAGCTALAFQLTRARKMVAQYPWLYRRHGLFGWREKGGGAVAGNAEKTS